MPALLSVRCHRTVSRLLMVHLLLLVTQVVAFSWHGAYTSAASSSQRNAASSGWQPGTLWWRSRRRTPGMTSKAAEGVWFGRKSHHHHRQEQDHQGIPDGFLELDNHIPTMGQPAFAAPRMQKERAGWGILGDVHRPVASPRPSPTGPRYVSLHYSAPALSPLGAMNRRNKLSLVKEELDQEIMKNVIKQVLGPQLHGGVHTPVEGVKSSALHPSKDELPGTIPAAAAEGGFGPRRLVPALPKPQSLLRQSLRSSSAGGSSYHQTFPAPSGFGQAFPDMQQQRNSFSDFSSLGFGSIVEPGDFSGEFGEPVMAGVQYQLPEKNQGASGHLGGGGGFGFGGFGQVDTAVGQFGWRDPTVGEGEGEEGQGGASSGIKPIPTAGPLGGFSQDDKDCDTILTKSCVGDSDCQCYGFYFCNDSGKCEDITSSSSSSSPSSDAAMTFGEKWHEGPAEKLGLTGRR